MESALYHPIENLDPIKTKWRENFTHISFQYWDNGVMPRSGSKSVGKDFA
jgi:hypothetical protein